MSLPSRSNTDDSTSGAQLSSLINHPAVAEAIRQLAAHDVNRPAPTQYVSNADAKFLFTLLTPNQVGLVDSQNVRSLLDPLFQSQPHLPPLPQTLTYDEFVTLINLAIPLRFIAAINASKGSTTPDFAQLLKSSLVPVSSTLSAKLQSINPADFPKSFATFQAIAKLRSLSEKMEQGGLASLKKEELLQHMSGLEVEALFSLTGSKDSVSLTDLHVLSGLSEPSNTPTKPVQQTTSALGSMYNFGLGSVAGAVGATVVYPIGILILFSLNCLLTQ